MKVIIFFVLLIFAGFTASSQVDDAVRQIVKTIADSALRTLDSTVKFTRTTVGTTVLNADTTFFTVKTDTFLVWNYTICARNRANGDEIWGQRSIGIKSLKGKYSVYSLRPLDGNGFAGEGTVAKATWTITVINNFPILKLTGITGLTMDWSICKSLL